MSLNSNNVRVAVTGAVYVAPKGSSAPTSATSAVAEPFKSLGYLSEDGITESRERSTNEIRAWQNADLVREVTTESSISFSFTLLETKAETLALYYGTTVDPATGKIDIKTGETGGRQAFVFDVIDGDSEIRIVVPEGEVVETGETVYQNGEAIGYELTVKAYATDGVSAIKYYADLASGA